MNKCLKILFEATVCIVSTCIEIRYVSTFNLKSICRHAPLTAKWLFFSSQVHSRRNNVWMVWPPSDETQSKLFPTCSYLRLIAVKTGWNKELFKLYLATWKCHRSNRFFHLMHMYVWMRTIFFIWLWGLRVGGAWKTCHGTWDNFTPKWPTFG